jgi:hypothetical protein
MVLMQRDLSFLRDLTEVNFLNTKRIYKLYGTEVNCRIRLKLMVENGYIEHLSCLPNMEFVYSPTQKTYHMMDKSFKKRFPNDKINHYLAGADFYFYMKNKNTLESFKLEQQYYFNYKGEKYSFRPDIEIESNGSLLLIEIDLSNRRFEKKIETWEAFYTSGEYKKHFDKFPPIVIVSTDVTKVKNIIEKIKKLNINYVYKDYDEVKNW